MIKKNYFAKVLKIEDICQRKTHENSFNCKAMILWPGNEEQNNL